MRTLNKEWHYKNGVYELRVELTQKSIVGFKPNGDKICKYIITPQSFYGMSKQECENKLKLYRYNDSHGFTKGLDKNILKYV